MNTTVSADGSAITFTRGSASRPAVAQMGESPMWTGFEEVAHTLPDDGALAALLPDAKRVTLPGQDHAVAPEAIAPVVRDFLLG